MGPVQRDLFSAWLAIVVKDKRLGEDERLRAASSLIQPAMGQGQPGTNPAKGQSRLPAQSKFGVSEVYQGRPITVARELADQPEPPALGVGSTEE